MKFDKEFFLDQSNLGFFTHVYIFVMKGSLTLEIGDGSLMQVLTLTEGQSFRIAPYTIHRFIASDADIDLIEVSTPELQDVVRISDKYGRVDPESEALSLLD